MLILWAALERRVEKKPLSSPLPFPSPRLLLRTYRPAEGDVLTGAWASSSLLIRPRNGLAFNKRFVPLNAKDGGRTHTPVMDK